MKRVVTKSNITRQSDPRKTTIYWRNGEKEPYIFEKNRSERRSVQIRHMKFVKNHGNNFEIFAQSHCENKEKALLTLRG